MNYRELIKDKKKIVVKIGSSSITHESTGNINYRKLEKLVRILCDIKNQGKDVVLVSSGAIAVGRQTVGIKRSNVLAEKQACAAIGQCRLMMTYQKLFSEYNQVAAQVLLTKYTMQNHESVVNAKNTFEELFKLDAIPVVNENDTVSTDEIQFGDNDRLSGKDSDLCLYTPYEIPLQILLAVSVPRHGFPYEILPLHPVLSGSLQSSCYYSASISTIPHFLINSDFLNSPNLKLTNGCHFISRP